MNAKSTLMNAPGDGAPRRRSLTGGAFALFSSLRLVAYLPMLWAIAASADSSQHSLLTWCIWLGSHLTTALWLRERARGADSAVLVAVSNAVMCAAAVVLIAWFRN